MSTAIVLGSIIGLTGCSDSDDAAASKISAAPVRSRPASMDELASRVGADGDPKAQDAAVRLLFLYDDGTMTPEKAAEVEKQLEVSPDNWQRRVQLAGFYSNQSSSLTGENSEARAAYERHALYLIQNHASVPGIVGTSMHLRGRAGDEAAALWIAKADGEPGNAVVQAHAVEFLKNRDSEKAMAIAGRGQALEPDNPAWLVTLAEIANIRKDYGAELKYLEQVMDKHTQMADPSQMEAVRLKSMVALAEAAWRAGETGRADAYSNEILTASARPNSGVTPGAVHRAHIVLGLLAAKKNSIDGAKQHLAEATTAMKQPGFSVYDTRMELAQQLLELNERDAVVEYLKQYAEMIRRKAPVEDAILQIQEGKKPDLQRMS